MIPFFFFFWNIYASKSPFKMNMFQALKKNSHSSGGQELKVQAHAFKACLQAGARDCGWQWWMGGITTWHLMWRRLLHFRITKKSWLTQAYLLTWLKTLPMLKGGKAFTPNIKEKFRVIFICVLPFPSVLKIPQGNVLRRSLFTTERHEAFAPWSHNASFYPSLF